MDKPIMREEFESYKMAHEADRYAHAPILIELHSQISEMEKLGWMVRGGLITIGAIVGSSLLLLVLHVNRML